MSTIFTKIINHEIPAHLVAEDEKHLAFLDIRPLQRGHTLVIPKIAVDYYFDLDDAILASLTTFSKRVAVALKKVVPCTRIGVVVIGLEVPHAHIHLIPINNERDLSFANPRLDLTDAEFKEMAASIQAQF